MMAVPDLLALARQVQTDSPRQLGADRTVAAALLVRQALEEALDAWWATRLPAMADTTDRAQQITLPFYADDAELAGDVTWAWNHLSTICHHHAYALPPTEAELARLIEVVQRLGQTESADES